MSNKEKIQRLAVLSVLAAVTVIVSFIPLKTLGLEITFSMVPVAIGAVLYGAAGGAVLGAVFGVTSFLQCLGYSPFGAALLGINPIFTFLVCVPTRILAGLLAGMLFGALKKSCKRDTPALLAATVAAPFLNTLFFMSALVAFFYNTDYISGFADALGASNPVSFIILFVGINGLVEIICGFAVAFPVSKALNKFVKSSLK